MLTCGCVDDRHSAENSCENLRSPHITSHHITSQLAGCLAGLDACRVLQNTQQCCRSIHTYELYILSCTVAYCSENKD